jgi:hypothetical protein
MPITDAMEEAYLRFSDRFHHAALLLQTDPRFRASYQPLNVRVPDGRYLRIWQLRR